MPLVKELHECGETKCENETHYYKFVVIPYSHEVMVGVHRTTQKKVGKVYLCPTHYEMPGMKGEEYVIFEIRDKRDTSNAPF